MTLKSMLLAVTVDGRWQPGLGDPTLMGWVTVAAYMSAALGCFWTAWREPRRDGTRRGRPSTFWLVLASLMVALGINKQLDLQSLVTQIGRDVIKALSLYEQRRALQTGFVLTVALACAGSLAAFVWAARRRLKGRWPALLGMLFILCFVVVRAASFHHVDAFLAASLGGLKWNWILELGGIAVVGSAALRILLAKPPRPRRNGSAHTYHYRINPG
jgi:hypothetical protein